MRTSAVFSLAAFFSIAGLAQTPLVNILSNELQRNFTALREKGNPPPYFLGYEVTDTEENVILASRGAIDGENHNHDRILDVTVRTGSPAFDNYRHVANDRVLRFTVPMRIALDDNADSIRKTVWLTTDRVYRSAAQRFIRLQSDEKLRASSADSPGDFSTEEPQKFFATPPQLKFNSAEWAARLRKVSAEMSKYPGALDSDVAVEAQRVMTTLVTSEGTQVQTGRLFARVIVTARGKANDGMDLASMETFETGDPASLPKDPQLLAAVEKAGKNLTDLLHAPAADPYVGPAILSGRAAGVFFHEIFGHRIEGHRQKDESEGQTFAKSVGKQILPSFLSVVFDPTRLDYDGVILNGTYAYDDEGVKARPVVVVDKGILKTFLMSRSPVAGFPNSNGHGRRSPGNEIVSRQSNLIVESANKVTDADLRKMLVEEVKKQNKPYGLYFDQVTGGYTTTASRGLQAFTVIPLIVYRVFPDGRPDELVRGADIVGTPLASFEKIMATGDKMEVFNGICGAESGNVPVSAVSPALLVSQIEIQRKERSQDLPPYLGRPTAEGQK